MSWEPESLAHWEKCLKADQEARRAQNQIHRVAAHSRLDQHYNQQKDSPHGTA